ncbi:MAG: hypothetical protein M1816_002571 [Peltula sp. TS41687]|nr:MAG: hypothetical protein M1816_002571 [Peltula sp. TS41687]
MGAIADFVLTCIAAGSCNFMLNKSIFPGRIFIKLLTMILISLVPRLIRAYLGRSPVLIVTVARLLFLISIRCIEELFSPKPQFRKRRFSDPVICYNILATTGIESSKRLPRDSLGGSPTENILPGIQSRSRPNRRLRSVFGVDNSFTTLSDEYCQEFRNAAEQKLNLSTDTWKETAEQAQRLTQEQVGSRTRIGLVKLVQVSSLRIILRVVFGPDSMRPADEETIGIIAEEINRLWLESKGEREVDDSLFVDEGRLPRAISTIIRDDSRNSWITYIVPTYRTFKRSTERLLPHALHGILPNIEATSRANPLNLILPAYETLWRVVLRCFIEVVFRNEAHETEWRIAFRQFLAAPTMNTFRDTTLTPSGMSIECIVNEALRLYPPTRRIYREFQFPDKEEPEIVAADLEACQRNESIWGPDSLEFNPARWKNIKRHTTEDKGSYPYVAFMPFGVKRFLCPANMDFGPRMIGLLVGALTTQFSSDEWKLESSSEKDEEIDSVKPLNSSRKSFWSYEMVSMLRLEVE